MLNTDLAFLLRAVHAKLDHKRLRFKLSFARDLAGTLCQDMIQTLLKPAALYALPFLIVFFAQKNNVFAWDDGRALWQRHHFLLHYFFHGAGDLYDEPFCLAARLDLGVACRFFQNSFGGVAVDPTPDFFKYAQILYDSLLIKVDVFAVYPTLRAARVVAFTALFEDLHLIPIILRFYNPQLRILGDKTDRVVVRVRRRP